VKAISPKERFAQYFGTELSDEEERVVDIIWSIEGPFRDEDVVSKAGPEIEPVIVWAHDCAIDCRPAAEPRRVEQSVHAGQSLAAIDCLSTIKYPRVGSMHR
jgi:hypothetical protein